MKTTLTPHLIAFLLGFFLPELVMAQATQSFSLKLEKIQKTQTAQGEAQQSLDLLNELKRQNPALAQVPELDLNRVEVLMKSGVGGAAAYLIVNDQTVDSQSVETNPDQMNVPGQEAKVLLKNLERKTKSAQFTVIGPAVIRSVQLILSAVQEPALLGSYAQADATRVGAATPAADRSKSLAVRPPDSIKPLPKSQEGKGKNAQNGGPLILTPGQEVPNGDIPNPGQARAGTCLEGICVNDIVSNKFGFIGRVVGVYRNQALLVLFPNSGRPVLRYPDQVILVRRGS